MNESMKQRREKRFVQGRTIESSEGWYAEVKDLIKRIDLKDGKVDWKPGKGPQVGSGAWYVHVGGREALFPFEEGCALDYLYKDEPSYEIPKGYIARDLREDAVYRLVELMEAHRV